MKKLIIGFIISLLLFSQSFAANEWQAGTGEDTPLGTENAADIDTVIFQRITDPLDRLNSQFRRGAQITYASASTLTVGIGEVTCQNSGGTIRRFRANTSATTVGWGDIDTGSEAGSTTYYLYAVADADATTFTVKISTNSTTPTSTTYYRRLGSFYNDSSSNITNISNDDSIKPSYYDSGWFSVTTSTSYSRTHNLGTTRALIQVYISDNSDGSGQFDIVRKGYTEATHGSTITSLSATTITLRTGSQYLHIGINSSGAQWAPTSGYFKVVMVALE